MKYSYVLIKYGIDGYVSEFSVVFWVVIVDDVIIMGIMVDRLVGLLSVCYFYLNIEVWVVVFILLFKSYLFNVENGIGK